VTSAIIFGVSWALLVGGGLYAQHGQLRSALAEGSFVRVEGVVYDTPRGPADWIVVGNWVVEDSSKAYWYRYDRSPLAVGYRAARPALAGYATARAFASLISVAGLPVSKWSGNCTLCHPEEHSDEGSSVCSPWSATSDAREIRRCRSG
jgi:hypothetical protein